MRERWILDYMQMTLRQSRALGVGFEALRLSGLCCLAAGHTILGLRAHRKALEVKWPFIRQVRGFVHLAVWLYSSMHTNSRTSVRKYNRQVHPSVPA